MTISWLKITLLVFVLMFTTFCGNEKKRMVNSMEISYSKGPIETRLPLTCNDISRINLAVKIDTIITDKKKLLEIIDHIKNLEKLKTDTTNSACDIQIVCIIKFSNKDSVRLCIGKSNCIFKDNIRMDYNDTIIYLIRKYSGYYNYFSKSDLVYLDELKQFGIPKDYQDLSLKTDSDGIPTPPPYPR